MNLSDFKVELVGIAEGSIEDISDPQVIRLLNRAIVNRYDEVLNSCDSAYMKKQTLTASSDTYELDIPTDFYKKETSSIWNVFLDENYIQMMAGKNLRFWIEGNKIKFDSKVKSGDSYYLRYSKKPTRYTAITDTFLEEDALEILISEVQALFYTGIDENEPNASYSNSLSQANRIA